MVLSLNHDGYKELEKICRIYLWGTNEEGNPKKAIIAWEEITRPKGEGGMEIRPFKKQAKALKMRNVAQLIKGHQTEWMAIPRWSIQQSLKIEGKKKERKHWEVVDALLLDPDIKITGSPTLSRLLKGWSASKDSLAFEYCEESILATATINQVLTLYERSY